ncbi:MAG: hypothetical protein ACOC71_02640 [Hyphomicrobiales bacterium]
MSGISIYCRGCRAYRPRYQFAADHGGLCRCCRPPVAAKTCRQCGVERPIDEYHIDRKARDGRRSTCRHCRNPYHHRCYEQRKREDVRRAGQAANRSLIQRLIVAPWA